MDTERWLPVPGYEGLYDVSDLGNVLSHYKSKKLRKNGALLSPGFSRTNGHRTVSLWRDKKHRTWPVHQLVLLAFVGQRPAGMESLHGPGGNLDDRLVNLRYGTSKENAADRVRDGVANRGERCGTARLTEVVVLECRRRYAAGETQMALAAEFGIKPPTLSNLVTGRTWRHLTEGLDRIPAPGRAQGEAHGCAKLTATQVTEIRARYQAGGISQYVLAAEYGVSQPVIGKIVTGKSWTHLLGI